MSVTLATSLWNKMQGVSERVRRRETLERDRVQKMNSAWTDGCERFSPSHRYKYWYVYSCAVLLFFISFVHRYCSSLFNLSLTNVEGSDNSNCLNHDTTLYAHVYWFWKLHLWHVTRLSMLVKCYWLQCWLISVYLQAHTHRGVAFMGPRKLPFFCAPCDWYRMIHLLIAG